MIDEAILYSRNFPLQYLKFEVHNLNLLFKQTEISLPLLNKGYLYE